MTKKKPPLLLPFAERVFRLENGAAVGVDEADPTNLRKFHELIGAAKTIADQPKNVGFAEEE